MKFNQTPPSSQDPKGPHSKNELPPQFTLEYYKQKQNGIERNLDDLLQSLLASLTTMDSKRYKSAAGSYLQPHHPTYDALDIKLMLQLSHRPDPLYITDDYQNYKAEAKEIAFWDEREVFLSTLTEANLTKHLKKDETEWEEASKYLESIRAGEISGLQTVEGIGAYAITTHDEHDPTLRINIKVSHTDNAMGVIHHLVELFTMDPTIVKNAFTIKTIDGNTNMRDTVIIYIPDESFTNVTKTVTDYFKDDFHYHDRHADPSIMFGTALEASDGSKFPGIRVTSEPKKPFSTYNEMQAALVSRSAIIYIEKYFSGDKDKLLQAFRENYSEAYLHFEQHFPKFYTNAVKIVFGNDVSLSNLAFLGG